MSNIQSTKSSDSMILRDAEAFSIKFILQKFAAVKHPYACEMLCHTCKIYLDYHSMNRPHPGSIACLPILKSRVKYVRTLGEKLFTLAKNGNMEFFDSDLALNKVTAPKKTNRGEYGEIGYWGWSQQEELHIFKEDLKKICIEERVNLTLIENRFLPNERVVEPISVSQLPEGNNGSDIPGKMPNVKIGQLAVKAAWNIERETNKKASASAVIKMLQDWVATEDILLSAKPHGVEWTTSNFTTAIYDVKTCSKTLSVWNKSRTS